MIPRSSRSIVEVDSNVDGERIDMSIDTDSLRHLMSVMTNLYSDTAMACIREYSTNARDAHLEAGIADTPIEVTRPSSFSPVLKIRDYGNGLSLDDIRNVYSKYGASTKRGSDVVNGMLGLGAKSALTYASSFTVVSVKDAVKTVVSVEVSSDGGGSMDIIDSSPSSEHSGVEIQIPVATSDITLFRNKVDQFFKFWDAGTVKIDTMVNDGFDFSDFMKIDDRTYFMNASRNWGSPNKIDKSYIVMGGVAYPSPFPTPFSDSRDSHFVYFAEMGDVIFSPSRESLLTNDHNRKVFDQITGNITQNIKDSVQVEIDSCPTILEGYRKAAALHNSTIRPVLGSSAGTFLDMGYKGTSFVDFNKTLNTVMDNDKSIRYVNVRSSGSQTRVYDTSSHYNRSTIFTDSAKVLVTGVESLIMDDSNRRRSLLRGLRYLGFSNDLAVTTETDGKDLNAIYEGAVKVLTLEEVRQAAREDLRSTRTNSPAKKKAKASAGTIDLITGADDGVMETTVTSYSGDGSDLIYMSRQDLRSSGVIDGYNMYNRSNTLNGLLAHFSKLKFAAVADKDQAALVKAFPKARHMKVLRTTLSTDNFLNDLIAAGNGSFTKEDVLAWRHETSHVWRGFDVSIPSAIAAGTKSPEFEKVVSLHNAHEAVKKAYQQEASKAAIWLDQTKFSDYLDRITGDIVGRTAALEAAYAKYPLARSATGDSGLKHVIKYVKDVDAGLYN